MGESDSPDIGLSLLHIASCASLNTLSTEQELEREMLLTDGVCKSSNPCSQNKALALRQMTYLCRFNLKLELTKIFF